MLESGDVFDEPFKFHVLVFIDGLLCLNAYSVDLAVRSEVRCIGRQLSEGHLRRCQRAGLQSD